MLLCNRISHQLCLFLQIRAAVMDEQCTSHNSPQRSGGKGEVHGRPGVIRCGWLRKQGGFVKTWHSRWFVLRGDRLFYYKDEEETKPLVRQQPRVCSVVGFWMLHIDACCSSFPLYPDPHVLIND